LTIAVPARHPLLALKHIPLHQVVNYPLVLFHPQTHAGLHQQIDLLLRQIPSPARVAEQVSSHEVMLSLVAAGYGLGLTCEAHMAMCQSTEIVTRPIAGDPPMLTSYLLRSSNDPSAQLARFITRVTEVNSFI
jgi:DNA-binding transcriptional LysR family regulator